MRKLSNHKATVEFDVKTFPYFYHSHFQNIGFATSGYYLDTNGNKYKYSIPELDLITVADDRLNQNKSNSFSEAAVTIPSTEYTIKPTDLFASLSQCTVSSSDLKLELTKEVIDDLHNAPIIELEQLVMDAGWRSNYIIFYVAEQDLYKRVLLASSGNVNVVNSSIFTKQVLESLL